MATEKIGIYRRWTEPAPNKSGVPIPKERWLKERRHVWEVRWFGATERRYSKNFNTRKEAEQYARQLQESINRGKPDRPNKITLRDFTVEHKTLMQGQVAYATLVDQMRALRLFENFIGGSTMLTSIHPRQAEAFVSNRSSSDVSIATVNKDIRTLKRIFNLAIEPRGYLHENQNPFLKIKQRKNTLAPLRYVTVQEYKKLLESTNDLWWKTIIAIAYGSGLRREEILNLIWSDIDFEKRQIKVTAKQQTEKTIEWEPKDHEMRILPMTEQASQFLADLQLLCLEGHPYPFISPARFRQIKNRTRQGTWNSISSTQNNLIRDFEVIQRRAGISKFTLHDLRRSALTNWAQHLPIQIVQQFAGHSNITTTRKYYLVVRNEDMDNASKVMDKILEGAKK
jgi:integrase